MDLLKIYIHIIIEVNINVQSWWQLSVNIAIKKFINMNCQLDLNLSVKKKKIDEMNDVFICDVFHFQIGHTSQIDNQMYSDSINFQ